ncbi:MAG: ribonuclease D [Gammaproteobacteria bacterium]|nr:ribonuclease D [Gammaproteobacteria bacterium]MBU1725980.1 ribonuclease D [Gammaproteobacteria bacterium]MBU2004973.1 ribonuclease D [Gammaproteobacteria bacterium]
MYEYIDDPAKLAALLTRLDKAEWVTLDTEFIREKTYYPRLCLIQIASSDTLACIDPLQIGDLTPFIDWLNEPQRLKVLHAAWQDMEIFHHLGDKVPAPLFDTQVAAAVLGLGDQLGYARLVEQLLGIPLDKSQSRTDWSRRPLSSKQLEYAIDDVRHLRDVYLLLREQLEKLGRLHWLDKPFQKLADPATYAVNPRTVWERVKNVQILKPRQLAILRELAAWREERALHKNIPRRWIISDEILVDLARMKLNTPDSMHQIRGLTGEQIDRYAREWLDCIARAKALPESEWPQLPRRRKLTPEMSVVTDLLMTLLNQIADENGISAQMVATRQQVEKMLEEGRTTLSDDWRGALVNELFTEVLNGKTCIRVRNQQVVVES